MRDGDMTASLLPASWYYVCASRALRPGRLTTVRLLDETLVVYRAESGQVHAVHSRCTHMGASLSAGTVVGDRLRCAMHHRAYCPDNSARSNRADCLRQRAYPVAEKNGSVFVFAGDLATVDCPDAADGDRNAVVVAGRAHSLTTSWTTLMCNAFDIEHMQAVHNRAMKAPPDVAIVSRQFLELRYVSRVTGTGLSDRIMKALSDDTIRVTIRCWGGTILTIQSRVGRTTSHLMLCVTPTTTGTIVTPLIAVPRGRVPGAATLRAHASRWLFLTFLGRDLRPLENMRLNLVNAARARGPLGVCATWLTELPEARIAPPADDETGVLHVARGTWHVRT
jgi:nitrite reductase/ring-hydroxylating ferredoxin subunit